MSQLYDQTLSLAGMFQAAVLIDELAATGNCDQAAFDGSFRSLFTFDADSAADVYGGVDCLRRGCNALLDYLGGRSGGSSGNIAYYVLSMMKIAAVVRSRADLSLRLFDGLQAMQRRSAEFSLPRENQVGKIDLLYQQTISHVEPRAIVRGDQGHLLNETVAASIRTLLLAGIRSAVLWQQLGGSKWKLFLRRKKYVAEARRLLQRD